MIAKLKNKKKSKKYKNVFFPVLIALLLLLSISFLVVNNIKINRRKAKLTAQISVLKEKIQQAEEKKGELENKVSQARKEENLEEIARNQLNLKKPGEEVVVVKKPEEENNENEEENKSLWELVKSIFNR